MKKIIILLGLCLLTSTSVMASNCEYSCVEPYDTNGKFTTFISNITGLNFAQTKISEAVLKKSILKTVKGDKNLKVDIESYSAKDLKNGIFKSLSVSGENVVIEDIYLSSLELKSICDFNYVQYDKKGNLKFKEDFPMTFNIKMNSDDINNTMKSEKYKKVVNDVNKLGLGGIKVASTTASIRGNKFYYALNIEIPFIKREQKVEISADINVKNGKIDFDNTRLASNSFNLDLKRFDFLMDYLNPLDFSVNIFNDKDAKIYIKNIAIKNNIIVTDGTVVVPKD
jgi:hypothetical protein